jgi:hypothetical protein
MNVMPAPLAGVGAFGLDAIPVGFALALRARTALTEPNHKDVFETNFIIGEHSEEISYRDTGLLFHASNYTRNATVCQGDNSEGISR